MQITVTEMAENLREPMKKRGYRKRASYWYREEPDLYLLVSLKPNTADGTDFEIEFGVFLKADSEKKPVNLRNCHVSFSENCKRYSGVALTSEHILKMVSKFERKYGSLPALCQRAIDNDYPYRITDSVKDYLLSVRFLSFLQKNDSRF